MNSISDEERKRRLEARKPKQKVKIIEELDDSFDRTKYLKYFKKWYQTCLYTVYTICTMNMNEW